MRQNNSTDADTATPHDTGAGSCRRQFLKEIAIPPAAAALAGCSQVGIGDDAADRIVEDLEPGDSTEFPGAIRFDDRYAMDVTRGDDGMETLFGRFHQKDHVIEATDAGGGNAVVSYVVDGDGYVVTDGECIEYPDVAAGFESIASIDDGNASDAAGTPELTVTETATIDGSAMLVFEPASGGPAESEPEVTYYVDEETRYLRRIETGTTTVEYHSWNDVEPIEAPAQNCR